MCVHVVHMMSCIYIRCVYLLHRSPDAVLVACMTFIRFLILVLSHFKSFLLNASVSGLFSSILFVYSYVYLPFVYWYVYLSSCLLVHLSSCLCAVSGPCALFIVHLVCLPRTTCLLLEFSIKL